MDPNSPPTRRPDETWETDDRADDELHGNCVRHENSCVRNGPELLRQEENGRTRHLSTGAVLETAVYDSLVTSSLAVLPLSCSPQYYCHRITHHYIHWFLLMCAGYPAV